MKAESESMTLGGGCFWCLEAVFQQISGVQKVVSGYAGGTTINPTYEEVCSGKSGHAEVVRLEFDPQIISYRELLEIFFTLHDPTTVNRQGNDVGSQYRSVIFYHDAGQQATAEAVLAAMASVWDAPIVTELAPLANYSAAETYHQNYFSQHPEQAYCSLVVEPKVLKARKIFADRLKK